MARAFRLLPMGAHCFITTMPSIQLSTRRKIQIARLAHRLTRTVRRISGRSMQGRFTCGGLLWELDLDEGIDFAIWLLGAFERDLQSFYTRNVRVGDNVLDLGANIGAHTLPLARTVGTTGRVIAVEATDYARQKLQNNLSLNPALADRVTVIHALLVAQPDTPVSTHLHSSWPLDGDTPTHPVLGGALKPLGAARALTVDQIVVEADLKHIDWIKLDVDGHELQVLKGATTVLDRHQPKIMMELAPYCHEAHLGQFEALVDLLHQIGYRFFRPGQSAPLPFASKELRAIIPSGGSINIVATPVISQGKSPSQ